MPCSKLPSAVTPYARQKAAARVLLAMARHPEMVAGTNRYCTRAMLATKGRALVKTGAEAVYTGVIPELGLGICLKIDDGGTRAAKVAIGQILRRLDVMPKDESDLLTPGIFNRVGLRVGEVRPAQDGPLI